MDAEEASAPNIYCPFCGYPTPVAVPNRTYLTCPECRRKVYEIGISAVKMGMLLDTFDELLNHSYDKEINLQADSLRDAITAELEARGFPSLEEYLRACRSLEGAPAIPGAFTKDRRLSQTALLVLSEMLRDYDFGEGLCFFENVLCALNAVDRLTASQTRLYKQLGAMGFDRRKSLSVEFWSAQHGGP